MTQKSRTHVYKILTPITPSVEKIINLHRLKQVYRPRNIYVLFSQCITMAWQCISPEVTVKDFKKYHISNAVDGANGMLWNDDDEDMGIRTECDKDACTDREDRKSDTDG
jgi:hypothetical protein